MESKFSIWSDHRILPLHSGEMTPFIFRGREYRVENVMYHAIAARPVQFNFHEDHCRIRDVALDRVLSHPLVNHYFATALVHDGKVSIFAADYGWGGEWWKCRSIDRIESEDLVSWSAPERILEAGPGEALFNNSVVYDGRRFVMTYETDDPAYVPFTCKFAVSDDLHHWEKVEGAVYGADKYIGGPALIFRDGWYYLTYVNCVPGVTPNGYPEYYDTRVARSRDLHHWEDAPADRPVLTPDFSRETDPERYPGVMERNASDAEFLEHDGKVTVFWNGGNQLGVADSQCAEFRGTLSQLLPRFFE